MAIRVQREDFDPGAEMAGLTRGRHDIGAVVSFVGLVREPGEDDAPRLRAMTLEHYPGMTEAKLAEIEAEAHRRWRLSASLIVHRYGRLEPGDRIVLCIAAAPHRRAAFEACEFLVDWLKTRAPFWKQEENEVGAHWVAQHEDDVRAQRRWTAPDSSTARSGNAASKKA